VPLREYLVGDEKENSLDALTFQGLINDVNLLQNGIHTVLTKEFDGTVGISSAGNYKIGHCKGVCQGTPDIPLLFP